MKYPTIFVQRPDATIRINEVVLRDGLQNESTFVPTDEKVALANRLSMSGISKLEVTSFTSPKAIPALRDAEDVFRSINRRTGVVYTALVPNLRGAERALDCRVDEMNLVMSASETHNVANLKMTREESFSQLVGVAQLALSAKVPFTISLSCSFGCPMEGEILSAHVLGWTQRFQDIGATGVTYCDTTGMAFPSQVFNLCEDHTRCFPRLEATLHFHNTRGLGIANVMAGLASGVSRYDASLGGIGGCPYAPGATGNICTEDLIHFLDNENIRTDVDLGSLLEASRELRRMIGHETPGQVVKAGRRLDLHRTPDGLVCAARERGSQSGPANARALQR